MSKLWQDRGLWNKVNSILVDIFKVYLFIWLLLNLYRVVFMGTMTDYMQSSSDLSLMAFAAWCGAKLSLQSTGTLTLISVPFIILKSLGKWGRYLCYIWIGVIILITNLLFVARYPFYKLYLSGYNQMLFTGMHEDKKALLATMWEQYHLFGNLCLVFVFTLALIWLFIKYINCPKGAYYVNKLPKYISTALLLVMVYVLGTLSLYGGGWSWRTGVSWENAGVTKDPFLNELILDDYEAIYRAYNNQQRLLAMNGLSYTAEQVIYYAETLSGKKGGNDLTYYLEKTAPGATIPKPKHIFIILSESYANWPLLPEYEKLHIADGMKSIIAEKNTFYNGHMLPAGSSTVGALMGMVTGLAQSNLYLTTMPEAMSKPYLTASAPQMKKLGYTTSFWYSGPTSWENVQKFTKAQGFDNFYSRGNLPEDATGSVWGADDEYLYAEVLKQTPADQDTFSIILNTSNHSPFNVDVESKGFPKEAVNKALPEKAQNDEELLKELGHFWYADKEAYQFIEAARKKFPDSIFILMGDHADRYNIDKTPNMYERYAIPIIITGAGINDKTFPDNMAGSQMDVVPSLIELIAPKGFKYYSVGFPLQRNKIAENYSFWMTHNAMGNTGEFNKPPYFFGPKTDINMQAVETYVNAVRALSWYLGKYGTVVDENNFR